MIPDYGASLYFKFQNDHELMMAFKGNVKTYWLVCKEGYAPPDYDDYFTDPDVLEAKTMS